MSLTSERIRKLRKNSGLTQKELADRINVSPQVVSNWERDYSTPDANDIRSLADALETSVDYLLGRIDVPHLIPLERHRVPDGTFIELTPNQHRQLHVTEEQQEFLRWVEENLEESFFYDFHKSPEEQKADMMDTLRLLWEKEKRKAERREKPEK